MQEGPTQQKSAGQSVKGFLNILALQRNSILLILFWELRGLSPNFDIHVTVSDLYIPRISPHIFLQQNRQTDGGNIKISHRYMSVGTGRQDIIILFWK